MRNKMLIITLSIVVLGCARLEIRKSKGPNDEGLPYYRPMPYLLISLGDNGFCKSEIIVLPDLSEDYRIIPHPGIGSIILNPTLTNGWNLTGFNTTIDTQIDENITAIAGLVSAVASLPILGKAAERGVVGPGLYRFVYDEKDSKYVEGLKLVGALTDSNGNSLTCPVAQPTPPQNK